MSVKKLLIFLVRLNLFASFISVCVANWLKPETGITALFELWFLFTVMTFIVSPGFFQRLLSKFDCRRGDQEQPASRPSGRQTGSAGNLPQEGMRSQEKIKVENPHGKKLHELKQTLKRKLKTKQLLRTLAHAQKNSSFPSQASNPSAIGEDQVWVDNIVRPLKSVPNPPKK